MTLTRTAAAAVTAAVLAGALLTTGTPLAGAATTNPAVEGRFQTPGVLHVVGTTQASDGIDAIHLAGSAGPDDRIHLEAEEVRMQEAWAEGYEVESGDLLSAKRVLTDTGEATDALASIDATIQQGTPSSQLLALPTGDATEVETQARGRATGSLADAGALVSVGHTGEARSARGETPRVGFSHTLEEATPALSGVDSATVEGNFTLFVHNATIEGTSSKGEIDHWTGRRSKQTAPGTTEFHLRVTVLDVTNGRLSLEASDRVTVLGATLTPSVNGTIASEDGARGRLISETTAYLYESTQVRLDGRGTLLLKSSADVRETQEADRRDSLAATVQGDFAVSPTPGTLATPRAQGASLPAPGWTIYGAALALPLAGVAVLAHRRRREDEVASITPDHLEEHAIDADAEARLEEGLEKARGHFANQAFIRAARLSGRLAREHPDNPEPWDLLGRALLELNEPESAAKAFERLDEAMDRQEPDAVLGLARAYRASGNTVKAGQALARLAQLSPLQAGGLLCQPPFTEVGREVLDEIHVDAIEAWIRRLLDAGRWETVRGIGEALARERPQALLRLAETPVASDICQHGIGELGASVLESLVEIAWSNDRLDLASNAFLALARKDPQAASELARRPGYRPLAEDARVQGLVTTGEEVPGGVSP